MLVNKVLTKKQPHVIELSQTMTDDMDGVQRALLVAMNQCICELRKAVPSLDTTNLTLENGLFIR
jgi:hypothetical protein